VPGPATLYLLAGRYATRRSSTLRVRPGASSGVISRAARRIAVARQRASPAATTTGCELEQIHELPAGLPRERCDGTPQLRALELHGLLTGSRQETILDATAG
jgi:hypothetical protein